MPARQSQHRIDDLDARRQGGIHPAALHGAQGPGTQASSLRDIDRCAIVDRGAEGIDDAAQELDAHRNIGQSSERHHACAHRHAFDAAQGHQKRRPPAESHDFGTDRLALLSRLDPAKLADLGHGSHGLDHVAADGDHVPGTGHQFGCGDFVTERVHGRSVLCIVARHRLARSNSWRRIY